MENIKIELKPIGTIHTPFQQAKGTPIQPVKGKGVTGWVEVDSAYVEGLKDLDGFERIWLLFWCHRASEYKLQVKPYMDTQTRGLFSTRAPSRPNAIGMSCVKLISVSGNRLGIEDVDMLDGTPLLDIKPYAAKFDHFPVTRCGWIDAVSKDAQTKADERFFKKDPS
jgi:tRNA-Thr(GGU) m(6)t(6)A37 methyltransferase TsaA